MPAAILGILGPLLPYILGAVAFIAFYLGVKRKGVTEERARQVQAQAAVKAVATKKVTAAVNKDVAIDQKVAEQLVHIKENHEVPANNAAAPSDKFTF